MNTRRLPLALAIVLGLSPPSLLAMGLGQLEVKSGLNQPLVAEIPIISGTPSELDKLDVRLASPEAFARVGLDRPGELTANLQFSVGKNARGQPVIRVTTPARFDEPVLSFLIEAEWGKGKVTREYTALIDPPYIAQAVIQPMLTPAITQAPAPQYMPPAPEVAVPMPAPEPMPVAKPVVTEPPAERRPPMEAAPQPMHEPVKPTPQIAARPPPAAPVPAPAPQTSFPAAAPAPAPDQYGPVSSGQTLWSIANSVRPDSRVSVNQMMVALLRANPDAFAQDNINRLKRGSVLRVPGQQELAKLSEADAAALVSLQASAWRKPSKAVPQPAEAGPAADSNISAAPATPAAGAPRVAAAKRARTGSRLEIVPPSGDARATGSQSGAAQGAGGSELRAELVQTREDLAARSSEVTELKSRVADLEKQQADRQRLIEMQNSQMKALQDRLGQAEAARASTPAAVVAAPETPGATPAGSEAAVAPAAETSTPWYFNPFLLGGALLIALGGLVFGLRRSKARSATAAGPVVGRLSDDEALRKSIAKTRQASERIAPVAAPVPAVSVAPADRPLEEARQAVTARPNDLEAHLTLLRLYHSRGNAVEYESAAQAMRQHLTSTMDPRWREAVIMGAALMPGHALFSQAGWNTPRYSEPEPVRAPAAAAATPVTEVAPAAALPPVRVFEAPDEAVHFDAGAEAFGSGTGPAHDDVHRNEAELMADDDASGTRIELAKAYLDIGDLDGARSMLEEVVVEGGPAAQAEARRILKEIG